MKVEAFFLADAATQDRGKLNVLGVFDTIFIRKIPGVILALAVVIRLRLEPGEDKAHELEVKIEKIENGEELVKLEAGFEIGGGPKGSYPRANMVLNVQNLKFKDYGEYLANLFVDGEQFASFPFFVRAPEKNG